jgi:hypothetical protein
MHAAFAADAMQSVIQISERTASLPPARPDRLERTIEPASRLVAAATGALGSNDLGDAAALGAREENVIAVVPATPIPEVFDGAIGFAAVPRIALDPQLFSGLRMSGRHGAEYDGGNDHRRRYAQNTHSYLHCQAATSCRSWPHHCVAALQAPMP